MLLLFLWSSGCWQFDLWFLCLFSKPGFNNMWTMNFQMFKLVLEKTEDPEIKLPTSDGSLKKQENSRKTSTSALLTMPKPLIMWITTDCRKFLKIWEYQTTSPVSWETCRQVKKQQLEWKKWLKIQHSKKLRFWHPVPSLKEFSTVFWIPHNQRLWHSQ